MYSVSIVICTYRRQKWVENLLVSISHQTNTPEEVIIVDSTSEGIDYTLPHDFEIKLIKSDIMQLTYQRNLGVNAANGEIILHLDDATFLEPDFIEQILKVFEQDKDKRIGAVSGYVTNQWGLKKFTPNIIMRMSKYLGIYDGDFEAGSVSPSGVFVELDTLQPFSGIKSVDFISGCSFAVREYVYQKYRHPEVIDKYGGEDKTFSRMISQEWELYIAGDAKLEHYSAPGGARPSNFSKTRSTVIFHLYNKKLYGMSSKLTTKLRLYYVLIALRMYLISLIMFLSLVKINKSGRWFTRASGYLFGAISAININE